MQAMLVTQTLLGDWSRGPLCTSPEGFVPALANTLVTKLLLLRQAELDKFHDDPEEFIKDTEAERHEFDLRVRHPALPTILC